LPRRGKIIAQPRDAATVLFSGFCPQNLEPQGFFRDFPLNR
jgi:hypothetical protein